MARRLTMKLKVMLGCLACLLANTTPAAAAFKGCYERIYDKRYLKKHRKQDIVKIRLQLGVGKGLDGPFELLDRIDAGFRKRTIYKGNLVACEPVGDELKCAVEADGGTFTVTDRGNNSLRIDNDSYINFGDEADGFSVRAKSEHKQFRLYRLSEGACP
jgi:hypothetical protein